MKRWKKLLAGLLAMAMALMCVPDYGLEVKAAVWGDYEYESGFINEDGEFGIAENGDCVIITKYTGSGSGIEIPPEIDGKKVTSIGDSAFEGCSSLTSVTIPSSVTNIERRVFSGCSGLESIKIDEGNPQYYSMNSNAIIETESNTLIYGCKNTIIPSSVTGIGDSAFEGCSSLTSITIPSNVTSIGRFAFRDCSGLASIDIPNNVESIGGYAFERCSGLTSVAISNRVTGIGEYAFRNCSGLTSVTIPNSVTSIGSSAFSGCRSLSSVTIPSSVAEIGGAAFGGCSEELVIHGLTGTAAETYAKDYEIKFESSGVATDISTADVVLEKTGYIYDGTAKTPSVTVKLGEKVLVPDTDYTVTYRNNTSKGKAKVVITGRGNYTGKIEREFEIWPVVGVPNLSLNPDDWSIILEQTNYVYDGKPKTPSVTLKSKYGGIQYILGAESSSGGFNITYKDNIEVGTATIRITRAGHIGALTATFTISKADDVKKIDISKATVTLSQTSYTYDGTAKTPTVTVTLDGKTLALNTDYTVTYSNNVNVGTAKVTVTGKGNYTGSKSVNFTIAKAGEQPDSKITCKKTAYKVTYGTKPFKINASSKSKMTFTSSKPKIAAVDKNTGKVTIKNTGVAAITIKAGNATKKVTIKVSPKKPSVKSAKTEKGKKLTVKWAKDKMASGYQVQISTDKNFKKNVKSKNLPKTSYTFTRLKAGMKYYVRIRSYKKSGKETLYSTWSKAKLSSKIKK